LRNDLRELYPRTGKIGDRAGNRAFPRVAARPFSQMFAKRGMDTHAPVSFAILTNGVF
jgi:hypothetical protein